MTQQRWTPDAVGPQTGRTVLVTGANSGLGLVVATEFARRGADVLMACRNSERARAAVQRLRRDVADSGREASVEVVALDTADLASVRRAAADVLRRRSSVDVLVNNAGVMAPPLGRTVDGFETQVATNHLGHFALTGLLLPALLSGGGGRVVTVSSVAARSARLDREDYQSERGYRAWRVYGRSKLSNLLFVAELQRRARAAGLPLLSVAAHPGVAHTNLTTSGPVRDRGKLVRAVAGRVSRVLGQPASQGAWPLLRAATDPSAAGGEYFGPDGPGQARGYPVRVQAPAAAHDPGDAAWLWARSAEWTGVDPAELRRG
ncbi:oxidoreductase [Kineococcus terrestris]|uniref:oxidoreductase n=1 Tax=Kineococcus terrestris TaxID=2044856 RepID=UPI0034DB722E